MGSSMNQIEARLTTLERKMKQLTEEIAVFKPDGSH